MSSGSTLVFQYPTTTVIGVKENGHMNGQRQVSQRDLAFALSQAAWMNNEEITRRLLEEVPSHVWNSIFENGESLGFYTPLHHSVVAGNENITRQLLDAGLRPDVRDHSGNTPLIWAALGGKEDLVLDLIESGANPNIQNFKGETALFLAVQNGEKGVLEILLENAANVNIATMVGETPLHSAVKNQNQELVQCLLEHGAFVNSQDEEGDSALHHAVRVDDEETMKRLLQVLLYFSANLSLANEDGETPKELMELFFAENMQQ